MREEKTPLRHFLLIFDHRAGTMVDEPLEFESVDEAVEAYEDAESRFDQTHDVEVVLIGSDSLETVRQTHANYFDGTAALARALAQILRVAGDAAVALGEHHTRTTKQP